MSCDHCTDPAGMPCYPEYGVAPHEHVNVDPDRPATWIGSTRYLPREQWPSNFRPDPDNPHETTGTYWCPVCGHGKPEDA